MTITEDELLYIIADGLDVHLWYAANRVLPELITIAENQGYQPGTGGAAEVLMAAKLVRLAVCRRYLADDADERLDALKKAAAAVNRVDTDRVSGSVRQHRMENRVACLQAAVFDAFNAGVSYDAITLATGYSGDDLDAMWDAEAEARGLECGGGPA